MTRSAASYEISPWRIAALLPVEASLYVAQRTEQIEPHTAHSLMGGVAVAVCVSSMNAYWQSHGDLTMTSDHRRLAAMTTGVSTGAVTMGLHPGIDGGKRSSDIEAAGLDALGAGILTGALTFALWRKRRNTGKP